MLYYSNISLRISRTVIFSIVALWLVCSSAIAITPDKYLALRQDLEADDYPISKVSNSPSLYQGKAIELRGTVSGFASSGATARIILKTQSDHYILTCDAKADLPSNHAEIVALSVIGEGSSASLTDLRLIDWCYESEVKAIEAAKELKVQKKVVVKQESARNLREREPTSRGYSNSQVFDAYRKAISSFNPRLSRQESERITAAILTFSQRYDIDPRLVVAIVLAESHFNPNATSKKGAMGLGQLMPGTARGLGVSNAYDPEQNLAGAIKLIRGHLDKQSKGASFGELTWNDLELALACYNAGSGAVKKHGGVPPYRETQNYIRKVISYYRQLAGIK